VKVYGQENVILDDFTIGERRISANKFEMLKSCELNESDVLVTMMGTIGKCAVFPSDAERGIMDSHLLRIQPDPALATSEFLALTLTAETVVLPQIRRLSHGSIMSGLSSNIVRRLEIPLPSVSEQQRIVEILGTVDQVIRSTEHLIAKLEQVKQGLLHDLLTRASTRAAHCVMRAAIPSSSRTQHWARFLAIGQSNRAETCAGRSSSGSSFAPHSGTRRQASRF